MKRKKTHINSFSTKDSKDIARVGRSMERTASGWCKKRNNAGKIAGKSKVKTMDENGNKGANL